YGYIKNHKKTVKNGQARTQERKSEQKPEAKDAKPKPEKSNPQKWRDEIRRSVEQGKGLEASPNGYK
ncbi:hypothetical protein Tco_0932096, partial [Tanacetum coccineum]